MDNRIVAAVLSSILVAVIAAGGAVCPAAKGAECCCCIAATSTQTASAAPSGRVPCCGAACGYAPVSSLADPSQAASSSSSPETPSPAVPGADASEQEAGLVPVALKSAEHAVAHQEPPAVFLRKASFLI